MKNNDYLGKLFKNFYDFISVSSSRELEYIVFDAEYTTNFNSKMKELLKDIRKQDKKDIDFTIMFNTKGEIAIIDSKIVGKYIGNYYNIQMEQHYKGIKLNKIVRDVINGKDKVKSDFIVISYKIIYKVLEEIYRDIKYNKSILNEYKNRYEFNNYRGKDISIIIISILILEDICNYIGIEDKILLGYFKKICDGNI
ncbi:hypothetical protein [Clostridium sp.]|uniref:hypothetical protein n=1 Tax=Clostridium sp. TaxID=1506 RepID=UPI00258C647D|nr:hypothetical protein [Clostridium sp.]